VEGAHEGLKKGPPGLYSILRRRAEISALPRVGSDENIAWAAMQLNVAAAVLKESSKLF
jgi:hypothetical protein